MLEIVGKSLEAVADEVAKLVKELVDSGRNDLLLRAIGVPVLEELRIEAAKARLSRLLITKDYRFLLVDYGNKEVMLNPVHKAVAAVHDGWRGTVQHLSRQVIDFMHERYGTEASDLKAVIGPGIGPESFQVGQEVVDAFSDSGFPMAEILADCGPKAPTADNPMAGGLHIDLWKANRWLLEEAGVLAFNIQVAGICTYRNNHRFFSARREGTKCGRIINCIKIADSPSQG